jgi:CubicO group peptidase (beta-lactamase class C family)
VNSPANAAPRIVHGTVKPGFEPVRDAFDAGVTHPHRSGAALSIWHQGEEVVSIWMGTANERSNRQWSEDTLNVLFSASKGLSTLVLARLAEAGRIDFDRPIGEVWPEFRAHGKGDISIGDVLAHRAGVSALPIDLSLEQVLDSKAMASRIAAQKPLWTPGTGHAYHALTWGMIAQELVRRVAGREMFEVFADEIASPLGADVTLKLSIRDLPRVARLTTSPAWAEIAMPSTPEGSMVERAMTMGGAFPLSLVKGDEGFNDPRVLQAGLAAAGGVGTASGLARIWSATVVPTLGTKLLTQATIDKLRQPRSEGPWVFDIGEPTQRWGTGVELKSDVARWLSDDSFGHSGAGGMCGMADPNFGIGLGYVRNRMDLTSAVEPITDALRAILL